MGLRQEGVDATRRGIEGNRVCVGAGGDALDEPQSFDVDDVDDARPADRDVGTTDAWIADDAVRLTAQEHLAGDRSRACIQDNEGAGIASVEETSSVDVEPVRATDRHLEDVGELEVPAGLHGKDG